MFKRLKHKMLVRKQNRCVHVKHGFIVTKSTNDEGYMTVTCKGCGLAWRQEEIELR